jgi:hypothetical protein
VNTLTEPERGHLMHNGRIHVTPESGGAGLTWSGWLTAVWTWLTVG